MSSASNAKDRAAPRRSSSISSHPLSTATTTISKGATARSAVNPRVGASLNPPRRPSPRTPPPRPSSSPPVNPNVTDALEASLKRETEEKERVCHYRHTLPTSYP
jgi:hypothetical protein